MKTTFFNVSSALLILAAIVFAGGCPEKKPSPEKKTPAKTKALPGTQPANAKAAPTAVPAWTAESILAWAPATAQRLVVVRDMKALYTILTDLLDAVTVAPGGAELLAHVKGILAHAPIPVPWTLGGLKDLGLDPAGAFAIVTVRRRHLVLLSLSDAAMFKRVTGKMGQWTPKTIGGVSFDTLTLSRRHQRPLACHITGKRAICSNAPEAAAPLIKEISRPKALGQRLDASQRAQTARALGFVWLQKPHLDALATATMTPDGVAVRADLTSLAFAQASKMLGPILGQATTESTILGLAAGSTSRAYVRLPIPLLGRLFPPPQDPKARAALGPGIANLTGELLALERPGGELAIVIGTKEQPQAEKLLALLGKLATTKLKKTKHKKKIAFSLAQKKIAGKAGWILKLTQTKPVPITHTWGIVAGKLGLIIGSLPTVKSLADQDQADAKAFLASLTAEDREVYGKGAIAGLQLALGDPLRGLGGTLDKMLPAQAPPKVRLFVDLGRFLFAQLDHVSLGQAQTSPQKMRIVASLHTLHRKGHANDDAARRLWRRGLKANLKGDATTFAKTLDELETTYAKTPYGALKKRQKGALFTTITGIAAAIAIPAFVKYLHRSKAMEARVNVRRLAMLVRMARLDNKLPRMTSGWIPVKPCCKSPKGRCAPDAALWSKPPWKILRFDVRDPSYFQYRYRFDGKKVVVEARGDFDCDGAFSHYQMEGTVKGKHGLDMKPLAVKDADE
ncbi:MAG: hypothetical protein KAI47_04210 [Deltaproteobacteria bacterium]|nr:hypothetical protein [Deltaproteobacteria bacterium]